MPKMLIVVDAPGPAEFIAPVIPLLKEKNKVLLVTVNTRPHAPYKILEKYKPLQCDKEELAEPIYKKFNPDVLIVAISSLVLGPYVNNKFTELAHKDGKKIICFQDFWANHRWPMNFKMIKYWNTILVPDELAKNFLMQDGYQGKIIVTGNPAFDKFRDLDIAKEREYLRKKFRISKDSFVILHCGTGTPQSWKEDEITFKFLAKGVRELKRKYSNIVFISRPHPRDENPNRYKELAPDLDLLGTSPIELTDELLPIADTVVAMYSTNLIHSCYLRIPAVSIILPDAGKKRLEKISLTDFPPNAIGATTGIYKESVEKLVAEIERIMNDSAYRAAVKAIQEKFFSLKEPATQKVFSTIKELTLEN